MAERRPLIAGNWKMHLTLRQSAELVKAIASAVRNLQGVDVLVAPPFTSLGAVRTAIGEAKILLGAQNMHWEKEGAYTGETSGQMLLEAGCTHVILGHSERRTLFGETNDMIDRKLKAAIACGLAPILCIGETLEERQAGKTARVIETQLAQSMAHLLPDANFPGTIVLAYEPVWAIGTGHNASPEQAQEVHGWIRSWVSRHFGSEGAEGARILYGGSVKPDNIRALMDQPDIDGALVGGASLKAESFNKLILFKSP
jgi:triosephosphate isomerase